MPIIKIDTNVTDPEARDSVTAKITDMLTATGVDSSHVATLFTTHQATDLFAGNNPVPDDRNWALVQVCWSDSRSDEDRRGIVAAILAGFDGVISRTHVSTDFIAREGGDVYIGLIPMGRRRHPVTGATPTALELLDAPRGVPVEQVEDQLRQALFNIHWNEAVLTAQDASLRDVLPLDEPWDSLAAVEAINSIADATALQYLDAATGTAEFAAAVSADTATFHDFMVFVVNNLVES